MPVATTLPSKRVLLRYPSKAGASDETPLEESYQLLELPAEILKRVEQSSDAFPLTIKGAPNDDAVLCTPDTTFLLRTVTMSNSLLICRPPRPSRKRPSEGSEEIEIRGVEHTVLECVPQAGEVERVRALLKDSAWRGLGAGQGETGDGRRWTRAQLGSVVPASEGELDAGLRERNVIEVDGYMLMLPPVHLQPLLTIILNLLTVHHTFTNLQLSPPTATVSAKTIIQDLVVDHDVPGTIASRVISLFGEVVGDDWIAEVRRMVEGVGRGLVPSVKGGMPVDRFIRQWKDAVGEMWEDLVDISLLQGEYLLNDPPVSTLINPAKIISHFPRHDLPTHPPTRFADLFLTRPKWTPEDMMPFLKGLTREGDKKELDKLVAKFVRVVKDKDGVWWFPRRTG